MLAKIVLLLQLAMVAERFRGSVSSSSRNSLEDPGSNPAWGMFVYGTVMYLLSKMTFGKEHCSIFHLQTFGLM